MSQSQQITIPLLSKESIKNFLELVWYNRQRNIYD